MRKINQFPTLIAALVLLAFTPQHTLAADANNPGGKNVSQNSSSASAGGSHSFETGGVTVTRVGYRIAQVQYRVTGWDFFDRAEFHVNQWLESNCDNQTPDPATLTCEDDPHIIGSVEYCTTIVSCDEIEET